MSNDLREMAAEIVAHGCPISEQRGQQCCFYCLAYVKGYDEEGLPIIDHEPTCLWPPFDAEASA